jgi:predicted dehydrogenase
MRKMADKVGVCVAGLGMGYHHAECYSAMKDKVRLFLCDVDAAKLAAAKYKLKPDGVFMNLDEALASNDVQAIDAALPHVMHAPLALRAAKAGKHFMTEKPMARTLAEADRMIRATERAGVKFMVAENQRFLPTANKAKELIDQGLLGRVFLVRVYELWLSPVGGWRLLRKNSGGGNLLDSGIHAIDTLRLLGSEIANVYARIKREVLLNLQGEDTAFVSVKFRNGAIGDLITSWGIEHAGPQARFYVYGTEGALWDFNGLYVQSNRGEQYKKPMKLEVPERDTFALETEHFIDCIINDRTPIMDGREGRKDLEVVLAAYRSAKTGRQVNLPLRA